MVLVFFGRIGDSVPGDSVPEFLVQQDKKDDVKAGMCNIMSYICVPPLTSIQKKKEPRI